MTRTSDSTTLYALESSHISINLLLKSDTIWILLQIFINKIILILRHYPYVTYFYRSCT